MVMENQKSIHIGKSSAATSQQQKAAAGSQEGMIEAFSKKIQLLTSSVSVKDKVVFYRLLATMVNAGMTLTKSMDILADEMQNPKFSSILTEIKTSLESGGRLSDGFQKYPDIFSDAEIGMIHAGESSGKLNTTLLNLAEQVEKSATMTRKLKGAMIYPAVIMLVVVGIFYAVNIKVVPPIKDMFSTFDADLPAMTKTLIVVSDFLLGETLGIYNAIWSILILVAIIAGIAKWKTTKNGKPKWDQFILHLPLFGELTKKAVIASFCRNLSLLIVSGLPLINAIRITSGALGNEVYRRRVLLIADDIKIGITIGDNLKDDIKYWPPMVSTMLGVGEKTAQLSQVAEKVADFYEDEVNTTVENFSKIMEPVVIVIVGGFVGFLVMAIMLPILSLSDLAGGG